MRSTKSLTAVAIGLMTALSGCGGGAIIVVDGIQVYENEWNRTVTELEGRAVFELACSAEQLEFHLFRREGRRPSEVGVVGCGRRGTYVRVGGTWALNATTDPTSPQ